MTSQERVRRAVLFQGPDRIPRCLPEPWGSDFLHVEVAQDTSWQPQIEGQDEWGCIWGKLPNDTTMGQVMIHPLDDYAKLADYPFPDFTLAARYTGAQQAIAGNLAKKFVLANIPLSFIHRLEYLRGHEAAWSDCFLYPSQLQELLTRLGDLGITIIQRLAALGAQGIMFADDWGFQDRLMVSPAIFREFFQPHYKRVYQAARQAGLLCFLHSCGYIVEILDDLIEAGLQVIQLDQQENMGLKNLAQHFGGRLCFWCPVDIQKTMVQGTADEVRAYARSLIWEFGRCHGGFMAKWYPAAAALRHSAEKINAMAETFVNYGHYPLDAP